MSSSTHSHKRQHCCAGAWTGMNIFMMVVGFVLFFPIGLIFLFWIISGRDIKDLPEAMRDKWLQWFGGHKASNVRTHTSENVVFNEYQQTQYDRIREIKEEIRNRAERFQAFRSDAKRREDEEEFNRFMSDGPTQGTKS